MRSSPWTSGLAREARFEIQDGAGTVLGKTESHSEAIRMLQAFVLTSPDQEEDVFVVSLTAAGQVVAREDLFDIEFG